MIGGKFILFHGSNIMVASARKKKNESITFLILFTNLRKREFSRKPNSQETNREKDKEGGKEKRLTSSCWDCNCRQSHSHS